MTDQTATLPPRTFDAAPVQDAIDSAAISALRSRLRGQLLRPGDVGYDDARSVWNAMIDRRDPTNLFRQNKNIPPKAQ